VGHRVKIHKPRITHWTSDWTDVRPSGGVGLTSDAWRQPLVRPDVRPPLFFFFSFFLFFPFFEKKNEKKPYLSLAKRATWRQWRHSICLPYTTGGIHSQNKHNRHWIEESGVCDIPFFRGSRDEEGAQNLKRIKQILRLALSELYFPQLRQLRQVTWGLTSVDVRLMSGLTWQLKNCLSPPRTLILDFTMTHTRYGRSQGQNSTLSSNLPQ
jgi:hypothetical protein